MKTHVKPIRSLKKFCNKKNSEPEIFKGQKKNSIFLVSFEKKLGEKMGRKNILDYKISYLENSISKKLWPKIPKPNCLFIRPTIL